MYRKNVAGQFIYFCMVTVAGVADTGATVTCKRCIDGGAQATATGTTTHRGSGQYEFALSQADTNGNNISYLFTATGDVPVEKTIVTTAADPTDAVRFGLTALPNAAAEAAGGLYTRGSGAGQINQAANGQVDVNAEAWNTLATVALPLVPTTAGRTLDVSAGGEAGVDWANVGSPTTTVGLTGTTIATSQVVASVSGAVGSVTGLTASNLDATISSRTKPADTQAAVTTVTNLTNAPTAGDLTATMKASVTTAATAATPTAAAVTGNVGGSVGSVVAAVAITSNVKKNQALTKFQFLMTDSTTNAPKPGLTVSVTRSIDNGAYLAGTLSAVTEISNGMYSVDFGAGDVNGNVIVLQATAVGANTTFERLVTQP